MNKHIVVLALAVGFSACAVAPPAPDEGPTGVVTSKVVTLPAGMKAAVPPVTTIADEDTFVHKASPNENEGALTSLRIQKIGDNRALIHFPTPKDPAWSGILRATMTLTIAEAGGDWGAGSTIAVHRLTQPWTEAGATWNCPVDADPTNHRADCGGASWEMGRDNQPDLHPWVETPTATATITNGQTGTVTFDVSDDMAIMRTSENYGWIVKKVDENAGGSIEIASRESATPPSLTAVGYWRITCLTVQLRPGNALINACSNFCSSLGGPNRFCHNSHFVGSSTQGGSCTCSRF